MTPLEVILATPPYQGFCVIHTGIILDFESLNFTAFAVLFKSSANLKELFKRTSEQNKSTPYQHI